MCMKRGSLFRVKSIFSAKMPTLLTCSYRTMDCLLSVLCFLNLKVIFLTSTKFCHDFYWVKDRSTFFRVYVGEKKEAKGGKSLIKETNPLFIQVDTTCSGHNQLSNFFFYVQKVRKIVTFSESSFNGDVKYFFKCVKLNIGLFLQCRLQV